MSLILGIIASALSALANIIDNFNRSDSASDLGSAGGQKWKIWRGIWGISSNKASSSTSASTYPIATLNFTNDNVDIGIVGATPGTGTSFWLSDADNWWAAVYDEVYSCQTCNWSQCNANKCNANTCNAWTCNAFQCNSFAAGCNSWSFTCVGWACSAWSTAVNGWSCVNWNASTKTCSAGNPSAWSRVCNSTFCSSGFFTCNALFYFCQSSSCSSSTCNSSTCNAWGCSTWTSGTVSCNCTTDKKINIIKSISGTISSVTGSIFNGTIASFKAILSGNDITIKAYSSNNYTSQIGSDFIIDATGASKAKQHGIIKSPATNNQGSTIDEFRVD